MDNVDCVGDESSLFNCSFTADHNCNHFEDAGVTCGLAIQCEDGWLVVMMKHRVEWKFVPLVFGEQSVMISGEVMMQLWLVNNLV